MRSWTRAAALAAAATAALAVAAPAQAEPLIGLSADDRLVFFDSAAPQAVSAVRPVTGLGTDDLAAIDVRPASGELYALGASSRIYRVNAATGAATPVAGSFTPRLSGGAFGFDFNPTVDRIRIVGDDGQNLRANPDTGGVAFVDGSLSAGASVTAAAYTNSVLGATSTTLYDLDLAQDRLVIQNPPNAGTLVPVGPLGVDAGGEAGFDISPASGAAYAVLRVAGAQRATLHRVDLTTGAASPLGAVGGPGGPDLTGLTAAPPCTITGTDRSDVLTGTPGDDVICGLLGNDTIRGGGGNDVLLGGGGNDGLFGQAGADRAEGGDGADRVQGDGGADVLGGSGGDDDVYGGVGDDVLRGAEGADVLAGEDGDDTADGGAGADRVNGGGGDDTLTGGIGRDALTGSAGADTLTSDEGATTPPTALESDTLACGTGADVTAADATDVLAANCE